MAEMYHNPPEIAQSLTLKGEGKDSIPTRSDGKPYRSAELIHGLLASARGGDESSFERLVQLYEPTVDYYVSQFGDKAQFSDDLRQEGLATVIEVIRRTLGTKSVNQEDALGPDEDLTVHIINAIRHSFKRYSEKDPEINEERFEKLRVKIEESKRAKEEYYKLLNSLGPAGYGAADAETRDKLRDLYHKAEYYYAGYGKSEINAVSSGTYKNMGKPPLSTDDPEVMDTPAENDTVEEALREVLKSDIDKVLPKLLQREIRVLELRFGLHGEGEHTLQEIARELGVTIERIRQIEVKALQKIRYHGFEDLREYL
jgi:RNA polymerase sigma factor (sigma-70 family)